MVDRVIVYPGALPQTTDILNAGKFTMVGQAYLNRAVLGTSTVVSGLACTPTSPTPDLHVTVDVGSIYQLDPTDAAAYGDLGTDANSIMKQGILATPAVLTITPPGTSGFSQVYLVQAILSDVDGGQSVISYYNSTNPASPYSGPANSGTSNFTTRTCPCAIALKAGTAATTGTQTTPSPDAGYVGLYAVTVANGQTQITSPNIVQLASAPFFPTLPSVPLKILNGSWVYTGVDTGAANAYVITFLANQPIPAAYVAGMEVVFKALNTNTAASTINVNGLGVVPIKRGNVIALSASDIVSGSIIRLTFDGTNFQMTGYLGTGTNTNTVTSVGIPYIADSGAQNALIGTYSPAITGGTQVAGLTLAIKLANTITGACTINVNGLGLKSVLTGDLQNPPNGVFVTGEVLILEYDGTQYQIANTSSLTFRKPSANLTIFVNNALGNDANDGVSNTSGHALLTIGAGVRLAYSYAPSQFTITIQVSAGTYNEQVSTPNYAGPNVIVNGAGAASTIVNLTGAQYGFALNGPNTLTVQNVGVTGGAVAFNAATSGSQLTTNNTASGTFTNTNSSVWFATFGGEIIAGTHTFNGSVGDLYAASFNGSITFNAPVHTFSTPIAVTFGSAVASGGGQIYFGLPPTFVNAGFVSGPKYLAQSNGVISANPLGVNYLPGTVAGSTTTGGQYIP